MLAPNDDIGAWPDQSDGVSLHNSIYTWLCCQAFITELPEKSPLSLLVVVDTHKLNGLCKMLKGLVHFLMEHSPALSVHGGLVRCACPRLQGTQYRSGERS